MAKKESQTEYYMEKCRLCTHFEFCRVYWGTKCKRQGGKEIPRMKTKPIEIIKKVNKQEVKKPQNPRKQIIEMFEPIRTKLANW